MSTTPACNEQKHVIDALFNNAGIDPKTRSGYVNQLMNMLATLNVLSLIVVLSNPKRFIAELAERYHSRYTEATYISRILSVFKHNHRLAALHANAHQTWMLASAEHRAKHLKVARSNAPTSTRQAANFVPIQTWHDKFKEMQAVDEPHSTLDKSMALLFMAYATCMPPKRAEVGTIRVFQTPPTAEQVASSPNYIILDAAVMHVTKHKTSKHQMHKDGIVEQLPSSFERVMNDSLTRWPRDALFVDGTGKPMSNQTFSKWVIRTKEGCAIVP